MKIITVADLIAELQKLPSEAYIFDMFGERFEEIKYCNEVYLGDEANPYAEITEGYLLQ